MAGGYDMMPWKLVFCKLKLEKIRGNGMTFEHCPSMQDGPTIRLAELPEAPEPGRIPAGCDHLHVAVKLSADQRQAQGLELWRAIAIATTRCEHGRVQDDRCFSCPTGWSPPQAGKQIGYYLDGIPVIVPPREQASDPNAWIPNRKTNR